MTKKCMTTAMESHLVAVALPLPHLAAAARPLAIQMITMMPKYTPLMLKK